MTPGGKPQRGDRIEALDWATRETVGRGTVTARGAGDYWSLTVLWDGHQRPTLLPDASWSWEQGTLRPENPSHPPFTVASKAPGQHEKGATR